MKPRWFIYLYCLLLAGLFLTLFSSTTSFMYENIENLDSNFYMVIGKYWAEGHLPYVELWDQKGPIIHFVNMLGYMICGSPHGIFFIQLLCLAIAFYYCFRFFQESFSRRHSLLLTIVAVFALLNDYSTVGNTVEEYLLPLLVPAFYYLYKWIDRVVRIRDNCRHPAIYAVLYGMVLSFSLLTRLTNALGICGGVAFVSFFLMIKSEWKNLIQNVVAFIGGFLLIFLPFALYFWSHGALDEMWYATFTYNTEYIKNAPDLDPFSLGQWAYMLKSAINGIILFFVSIMVILWNPQRRIAGWLWLTVDVASMVWLMTSNGFYHYFIITLPYLCISMNEISELYDKKKLPILRQSVLIYSLTLLLACSYEAAGVFKLFKYNNPNIAFYEQLKKDVSAPMTTSFVAYNVSPYLYLHMDVKPAVRFFCYQDNLIAFSNTLKDKVRKAFMESKPHWILVNRKATNIKDIIDLNYSKYKEYENGNILYFRTDI
ncbi:MAG: glycosyltransferase family 39 protein [Prevotella sp.]|jgi:hypothetical protein